MFKAAVKTLHHCNLPETIDKQRHLWQWINLIFNRMDEDRRKRFGPDRTCAEWILRNGGSVKFTGMDHHISDYNSLPPEGTALNLKEVDATESSIMHQGFEHFVGCKFIEKLILHKCDYLEDPAIERLLPLVQTLKYLQISSCRNITEKGLMGVHALKNLKTLLLYDLPYVTNSDHVVKELKNKLPQCDITFK